MSSVSSITQARTSPHGRSSDTGHLDYKALHPQLPPKLNMHISVVIATLRRPELLQNTLKSLLACSPLPHEIIVVDGDPEMSSLPVVEELRSETPLLEHLSSKAGLPMQRNVGLQRASGEVCVFLDDDVVVDPAVFEVVIQTFEDPSVVGMTGRVIEKAERRFFGKRSRLRALLPGGGREGTFTRYGYPHRIAHPDLPVNVELMHGSFMCARLAVARDVRFDENLHGYALAEDEDFAFRLSRRGQIRYVPDAIIEHLKSGFSNRDMREFGRMLVANRTYLFRKNFESTWLARCQFALFILALVIHRILNREWEEIRGLVEGSVEAWRSAPPSSEALYERSALPVTFVSSHSRRGGSEKYLQTLIAGLERPWIGQIFCLEQGHLVHSLEAQGLPITVVETTGSLRSLAWTAQTLRRSWKSHPPRVVHANGLKAAVVASSATIGRKIPVIWVKHDFSHDGWLANLVALRCRKIVGVSHAVTRNLSVVVRRKIEIVYTGIPEVEVNRERGKVALAQAVGSDSTLNVGLVGRLNPLKGHLDLLEILPSLMKRVPNVQVVFLGGPDQSFPDHAEVLRGKATQSGVEAHVTFLGHRNDALEIIGGFDLGVIPSRSVEAENKTVEGFPVVALEMLLLGVPVVAYASGGLPEVLGNCGRMVRPGNTGDLLSNIVQLLENEHARDRLRHCGVERVRQQFSFNDMKEDLQRIYLEAARPEMQR